MEVVDFTNQDCTRCRSLEAKLGRAQQSAISATRDAIKEAQAAQGLRVKLSKRTTEAIVAKREVSEAYRRMVKVHYRVRWEMHTTVRAVVAGAFMGIALPVAVLPWWASALVFGLSAGWLVYRMSREP